MESHAFATSEVAHVLPFICFTPFKNSINSLVIKHPAEFCPLSGGANLEPLSVLITRSAFASSAIPYPHSQRLPLRSACPYGQEYGLDTFHLTNNYFDSLGSTSTPAVIMSVYSQAWRGVTDCTPFGSSLSATLACSALTKLAVIQLINHAINKSLHPNRLVASSFIRPSRFGFQAGLRLYPLPNSAITGRAGDNGFIQRNGWFGRHCRQTVKLSDFVSHPHVCVERIFGNISVDLNLVVLVPLPKNTALLLL